MVQMKGVEPLHRLALDPKSSASANSATSAYHYYTSFQLNFNRLSMVFCKHFYAYFFFSLQYPFSSNLFLSSLPTRYIEKIIINSNQN